MSTDKPVVAQVDFASLDTRHFTSLSSSSAASSDLNSFISAHITKQKYRRSRKKAARKQERQRIFAQTQQISPEKTPTIMQNLRIQDNSGPHATSS
ncbi:hypothetical protein GGS21DRAFT_526824 [Xylaria nigripes]|nr:hypothetical protein GGS21DRAFT_526824 [Xylaria nigripes]